jgi:hypothetical protein
MNMSWREVQTNRVQYQSPETNAPQEDSSFNR